MSRKPSKFRKAKREQRARREGMVSIDIETRLDAVSIDHKVGRASFPYDKRQVLAYSYGAGKDCGVIELEPLPEKV